jgi:hypothetical protein
VRSNARRTSDDANVHHYHEAALQSLTRTPHLICPFARQDCLIHWNSRANHAGMFMQGFNAVGAAAAGGHLHVVKFLVQAGVAMDAPDQGLCYRPPRDHRWG